ncbi:MAG TPA: hypothetical protein VGG39_23705 [Polyangiaceae bacterium]|jgi:hypothetical protein
MTRTSLLALLLLLSAGSFAACGSSNGDTFPSGGSSKDGGSLDGAGTSGDGTVPGFADGGDGSTFNQVQSVYFVPPTATVSLTPTATTASASFTLMVQYASGATAQVDATSLQFDRPDLAAMTAGEPVKLTASGPTAGVGTLHAVYANQSATAKLTVQIQNVVVGAGVPPQAVTALGGAGLPVDPSVTSLLYPYDQTIFPLGLGSPIVMWNAPNANDVYRLHYEEQNYTYDGYFLVAQPAQINADQTSWDRLTASNGGDPLKAQLSRWDATTQTAYASASESWKIAPSSLQGAIYYWTVSGTGHMSRIYPGTGSTPEILNGGTCMGCHAVSADGTTLVASVENEGSTDSTDARAWVSYDLPGVTVREEPHLFGGNVAVTPNGKNTVFGTVPMHLGDTTTGAEIPNSGIETFPLAPGMATLAHPVFSPDGKHFAAVQSNNIWYEWTLGKMVLWDYDQAAQTFTNPLPLADGSTFTAPEQAIAYPSFSPDSNWIAFHAADHAGGCHDACDATTVDTGALWMQSTTGSAPTRLTTLTDSSPSAADHDVSFEPTFNPVERGGYFWVVFTSMRDWGNRVTGAANCGKKRLWVAAIDATPGSSDPSHPAFFIQGQEEDTMNMRGFWSLAACIQPAPPGTDAGAPDGGATCTQGYQCCSGFCDQGVCTTPGTVACSGVGDTCTTAADCCNSSVVSCVGGTCQTAVQ